jgi:DNA invertase Pin-like site-specific DNA recombinase
MRPATGYIRVSTAKQGRSSLGIEAQQEALQSFAEAEEYRFAETFTEVESDKHGEDHRPALADALERARDQGAAALPGRRSGNLAPSSRARSPRSGFPTTYITYAFLAGAEAAKGNDAEAKSALAEARRLNP